MKRNFEDPELKVTRFDYEGIMVDVVSNEIPDTDTDVDGGETDF